MIKRSLLLAALLAASSGMPSRGARDAKLTIEQIIKRWADGPARYLMTTKEDEQSRTLKSVPELARFITTFWARRDPTPGTLENEYRRTYWRRVLEADKRFRDSTIPGWKTDRGKVFILLGAPDDVVQDEHPNIKVGMDRQNIDFGSSSVGKRGIERWTYRRRQSRTAEPEFVVAFVRDESLDWRLSTSADLIEPNFPGTSAVDNRNPTFGGTENPLRRSPTQGDGGSGDGGSGLVGSLTPPQGFEHYGSVDTSAFANYDLGLESSLPSNLEEVIATVTAHEFLSAFSASTRFEYFRAQEGATFVNIGALIQAKDLYGNASTGTSDLRIYASFTPVAGGGQSRYATNEKTPAHVDLSSGPSPGGCFDVWTGLALNPGRYQVTVAIEDTLTGRLGRSTADLEVPDFTLPGLRFSTVLLASSLSDTGGRLGVTTRSSSVFRKSESMGIYYEVYGLEGEGGSGSPGIGGSAGTDSEGQDRTSGQGVMKRGGPDETSGNRASTASEAAGSNSAPADTGSSANSKVAKFDATYRFYREVGGEVTPIGKPIVFSGRTEAIQGWSFPLAKWPPGHYRIEVMVADPQNHTASAQLPFEVID